MLNRRKHDLERRSNCNFSVTNNKSWMFHQFPVRYTSPRMQRGRRAIQKRHNGDIYPISNIPVGFNANVANQRAGKQHEVEHYVGARSIGHQIKPFVSSCFIEKYELKERFKVVEVHEKVCKHCDFHNLFYKTDLNPQTLLNNRKRNLSKYADLEPLTLPRPSVLQDEAQLATEVMDVAPPRTNKRKQKIVVKMPDIYHHMTSDMTKSDTVSKKTTLSFTHRKH